MKTSTHLLFLLSLLFGAAHADEAGQWLYFKDLATRSLAGDGAAFRTVLAKAETLPPGEQLEELAEISSRYLFVDPADFLKAQSRHVGCFGVDFMGAAYVDNPDARSRERAARYRTLEAVADPALARIRQSCLAVLGAP